MKQECERCGSCCVQYEKTAASEEDIRRWVCESRSDILLYCYGWNDTCSRMMAHGCEKQLINYLTEDKINLGMWHKPENREENLKLCPFLRKKRNMNRFECMIQGTKPEICRNYICDPKDMQLIIKRSFEENLEDYRKKRKRCPSFIRYSPFMGNPLK